MTRILVVLAVLSGLLVMSVEPSSASAPCGPSVSTSAGHTTFDTGSHNSCPSGGQGGAGGQDGTQSIASAPQPHYSYLAICNRGVGATDGGLYCGRIGQIPCGDGGGGYWYHVTVTYPDGRVRRYDACLTADQMAQAQPVLTLAMIEAAFRRTPVPQSQMTIAPPGGVTLVNLPAIYSTTADPFERTFTLVGQRVDLRIVPSEFAWVPGDGSAPLVTDDPGTPYSPGVDEAAYIEHTYLAAQRVSVRVDVTWTATFRVGGAGTWRDVPGSVTRPGVPAPLRVRQAQGLLTGA